MTELNDLIDELLDSARPDRYQPSDNEWLTGIIATVAGEIPDADARLKVARDIVVRREAEATKRTNRVLREVHASGQLPLDWLDHSRWPLSVGCERVALGSCTAEDFREFANVERRRAVSEFTTRNVSCEGAAFVAKLLEDTGVKYAGDLIVEGSPVESPRAPGEAGEAASPTRGVSPALVSAGHPAGRRGGARLAAGASPEHERGSVR